jgi:hypothetical protein
MTSFSQFVMNKSILKSCLHELDPGEWLVPLSEAKLSVKKKKKLYKTEAESNGG